QDPKGGPDNYAFDLTWGANDRQLNPFAGDRGAPPFQQGRAGSARFTTDQAVRVCQDAVRQQAGDRFRTGNVAFRRTNIDDNPGRQDFVTGVFDIRRGYDRDETYNYSCSVNFDTGEVRS